MTKIGMLKTAGTIIVGIGVDAILSNVTRATTPREAGKFTRFCIAAGTLVLSFMIGEQATKYTEEKIDQAVEQAKNLDEKPVEVN
jgi:hypothetical protein